MKFRKKPVVITAVQWTGDNDAELDEFTGNHFRIVEGAGRIDPDAITAQVHDVLHDTWVGVKTGQWVIRGVKGEMYPIDPEVLAETYEPVEDAA